MVEFRVRSGGDLDDEIDAVGCDAPNLLGGIGVLVVDDLASAGGLGEPRLRVTLIVAITVAPAQRASWIAVLPTAPAPPATSRSPSRRRRRRPPQSATEGSSWPRTAALTLS